VAVATAAAAGALGATGGTIAARRTDVPQLAELLAPAATLAAQHASPALHEDAVPAATPTPRADAFEGWIVLQAQDCDGRLDALQALRRPMARRRLTVAVAVIGSPADRDAVASRLAEREFDVPVTSASADVPRAVRALGFRATPLFVVLDAERRVHWAVPLPSTLEALGRWYAAVPAIVGA
jgi:hypothetical protein